MYVLELRFNNVALYDKFEKKKKKEPADTAALRIYLKVSLA